MSNAVITSEPRVYGPGSERSYFQDRALSVTNAPGADEARLALAAYAAELDVERRDRTPEGRRADAVAVEVRRMQSDSEQRAASSSTLAGFTTPAYLVQYWAAYRSAERSFTDQCTQLDLPPYGVQVNIPSFASTTTFSGQTENSGVSDTDPSGANLQTSLTTQAGRVTISQQLYDRGGMTGDAFDKILLRQMASQLDAQVDSYVLAQSLANAGSVSDSSAFSIANFLADIASAREKLSDTAGTRLLATHLFSTSDLYGYVTRQVDSTTNRPILTPDSGALVLASTLNDAQWNSWTGVHLGQLRWHTDDNIPASGSDTQIIVARPAEVFVFQGEPISFASPQTNATTLSVVVGLRSYVAAIARFAKSVAVISGSAYPLTLV